jgi:hypothetical protein
MPNEDEGLEEGLRFLSQEWGEPQMSRKERHRLVHQTMVEALIFKMPVPKEAMLALVKAKNNFPKRLREIKENRDMPIWQYALEWGMTLAVKLGMFTKSVKGFWSLTEAGRKAMEDGMTVEALHQALTDKENKTTKTGKMMKKIQKVVGTNEIVHHNSEEAIKLLQNWSGDKPLIIVVNVQK